MKYFRWISKRIVKKRRKISVRKNSNHKEYLELKETARALVKNRLEYFNQHYKFVFGKVAIRNQRSRWGSCSSKGNLNFNFRIATLPSDLADYIIVHELCHRGQFNHSQKFWDLISETIPNYEELIINLRKIKIR